MAERRCTFKCGDWNCGSYQFNLYKDDIDQGGFCDVHYWQGRAHRAEALAQPAQEPVAVKHMLQWIERLKSLSNHGQYLNISGLGAGACWELANELEQFIKTAAQPAQDGKCKFCVDGCIACDARELPAQDPNTISTEELVYMTGVYDGKVLEREACAKVCESYLSESPHSWGGTTMAAAIRARGNT
jgi:hypothetical protein